MSTDEPIRLRLHQRLTELLDPELADAMMASMPPMRWDQLATKDDIALLDARIDEIAERIDAQGEALAARIDAATKRMVERIDAQGMHLGSRIDAQSMRLDTRIDAQNHSLVGEMALLEGRLSVRYVETTRMIVFAMMTLFVGVVAVMATTLS